MSAPSRKTLLVSGSLLLLVVLMWLYPLATQNLTDQHDIPTHLRWADQFAASLRDGVFLPRWAYASLEGLGDPTFFYYQPLFYYLTSAAALLGFGSASSLILAAMLPYFLLGAVVYRQVFSQNSPGTAVLATLFVVGAPLVFFLSVQVGAFPWTLSLPFSVLFALESTRERPRYAPLALLLALICLSHLLSALITLAGVGLGRLLFAFPKNRHDLSGHATWGLGVALGLALSAFFIYPAVTQLDLINPAGWVDGEGVWRKSYTFPILKAGLGLRWAAIQWPLATVVAATIVLSLLLGGDAQPSSRQRMARRLALMALATFVFSMEIASPLWELLAPLRKVQYPYRFIFLAGVLANIALMIRLADGEWQRRGKILRSAITLVILAQCGLSAYLQVSLYRSGEPLPTRDSFMSGRFGTSEYHPAVRGPDWDTYIKSGKLPAECKQLAIQCESIIHRTHAFSVKVTTPQALRVRLPIFAFPAWQVSVDGKSQRLLIDQRTGLVAVDLLPGRHEVNLSWSRLPAEVTGIAISLTALGLLLTLLGVEHWHRSRVRKVNGAVDPSLMAGAADSREAAESA